MKKLLSVTLCLVLIFSALPVFAITASAATSGYYTYTVSNGEATITDCNTSISGDVTIPFELGGYRVTGIGNYAFYDCTHIATIVIPNCVTSIGTYAFSYCYSLMDITIPDSVQSIGAGAFYECSDLTSITIPNGVTTIGGSAFGWCLSLTTVKIPNTIVSIGNYAFARCSSLTSITIGDNLASIGKDAFLASILKDVYYRGSQKSKEKIAIELDNDELNCATWHYNSCIDSATHTYDNDYDAVCNICGDAREVCIENFLTYTVSNGEATITDCDTSISGDVTIPSTLGGYPVTKIGRGAFSACTDITSIIIPKGIVSLDANVFMGCTSLRSIYIPNSITTIGDSCFVNCPSLTSVYITDLAAWCNIAFGKYGGDANPLYYAGNLYLNGELVTDLVIPNGVTTICKNAFNACTSLESVTIPDSVTTIGYYAFNGCSSLKSVNIPDSVTIIDDYAFNHCTSLVKITIPNSVISVGERAFSGCCFTSITMPNSVTTVGNGVFEGCNYLTSVSFGNNLQYMGCAMFYGCESLKDVTLSNKTVQIPMLGFYECTSLSSITIPESVTGIGESAFANCPSLASITILNPNCTIDGENKEYTISDTATIYGYIDSTAQAYAETYDRTFVALDAEPENAITGACGDDINWKLDLNTKTLYLTGTGTTYNYTNVGNVNPFIEHRGNINTIIIGDGITRLGNRLFRGLSQVESVTFGKDITTMGHEVFYSCGKLAKVELNEGLTALSSLAFYNCKKLAQITIPSTVTNINSRAFKGTGLTSIDVPDTVRTLGYEVFMNCASLESVDYTRGVSMLSPRTFENCTSLKTFYFTSNMCRIRQTAFAGCTALESITFENADNMWGSSDGSEAKIASNAFTGCNSTLQMIAKDNSHVEEYANKRGFTFVEK